MKTDQKIKKLYCESVGFDIECISRGLNILDGSYLRRLICTMALDEYMVCFEGKKTLTELHNVFEVTTDKGVKKILKRLELIGVVKVMPSLKYHDKTKYISIDIIFLQYFARD